MDERRFDSLSRQVGQQSDRRGVLKVVTAGALSVLGMGALGRTALGQEVSAESNGFKGDKCDANSDCKKGLVCNENKGKCEYKKNCGGKKGSACKKNNDCCNGKNLTCKNRKCKRDKKNR